jgi:methionine synthase II (cobalamin-independent)
MMSNLSFEQTYQKNDELLTATEKIQKETSKRLEGIDSKIIAIDEIAKDTIVDLERQREQIVSIFIIYFPFDLVFISLCRLVFLLFFME